MKKLILTAICLTAGVSAFAQGFVNVNNNFTVAPATQKAFVLSLGGTALSKAIGRVEVLGSDGTVLSSVKDGSGNLFNPDGLFFAGIVQAPNTVGGAASIVIRSWDNSTGATYALATVRNSAIVNLTGLPTDASIPSPSMRDVGNWTGMQLEVIPEPSTVALAGLGLVGLFYVARRK